MVLNDVAAFVCPCVHIFLPYSPHLLPAIIPKNLLSICYLFVSYFVPHLPHISPFNPLSLSCTYFAPYLPHYFAPYVPIFLSSSCNHVEPICPLFPPLFDPCLIPLFCYLFPPTPEWQEFMGPAVYPNNRIGKMVTESYFLGKVVFYPHPKI